MRQSLLCIKSYLQCLSVGVLTLCIGSTSVQSQTISTQAYCVGPAATGNGSGADWNNLKAWSSTPARGDTWYLVAGNYPGKTFSTAPSGSTYITIEKATASNYGNVTSVGWQAGMANQAVFTGEVDFTTSCWVFDGVTPASGLWDQNVNDYGFMFSSGAVAHCICPSSSTSINRNFTIAHVAAIAPAADEEKFFLYSTSSSLEIDNVTVDHCYMSGFVNDVTASNGGHPAYPMTNWIIQYCICSNGFSSSANHGEDINNGYGNIQNWIIRYNLLEDRPSGTGEIIVDNSPGTGTMIYGNVFYNITVGNGVIGIGSSGISLTGAQVYNNTFISCPVGPWIGPGSSGYTFSGCVAANNLFYNMNAASKPSGWSVDYGVYFSCSGNDADSHIQTGTGNPFVNYTGYNFLLTGNTTPGVNLGAPYNVDALGNPRTTWTRGAFEFTGNTNLPPVNPILQVTPGSIGYGTVLVGMSKTNSFTVQNVGTGMLSGSASVSAPFSVVGGGSYSLGAGQSQTVTVVFSPSAANNYSQSASFSGVSGTSVTVNGSATNALVLVPLITNSPSTIFTKTITASITNPITLQFATNLTSPTWQTIGVFAGSTNLSFTNMPAVFIRGVCSNLTGSVSLTWPPSTDPFLLGYNIYCGTVSQTYTSMITVGKVTNMTIPNLTEGKAYYFVVKSYDLFGFTFQLSSEISAMPQATDFSLTFTGQ